MSGALLEVCVFYYNNVMSEGLVPYLVKNCLSHSVDFSKEW